MGLFSNTSSVKKAMWLYEAHCCSKCGKLNASRQKIILQYRYDDIALSRSEANRKAAAEQKLNDAAEKLAERASDPQDIQKYYDLNLLGKCTCGHREPWSRMRSRIFDPIFNAMVAMSTIALLDGIVQIFIGGTLWILLIAAGLIAVTVGMKLLQRMRRKKREQSIAALDARYIPYLTADEAAFSEQYPEAGPDKLEKIEPSGNYTVSDD